MTEALVQRLEALYRRYVQRPWLDSDPLGRVHAYRDPRDREVAGFLAAGLAFGNVRAILASVDRALAPLGDRPARRLATLDARRAERLARGFNHRWIFAPDLANAYRMLGGALREAGGLEPLFAAGTSPGDADVRPGAVALVEGLRRQLPAERAGRRGTRYLLPAVAGEGASKRLMMYLRWMVRDRDLDLGLWRAATPAQLLMPLDVHVSRLVRELGLTRRRTVGRAMMLEVSGAFRAIDPHDPIRFDFALTRLGMLRSGVAHPADDVEQQLASAASE